MKHLLRYYPRNSSDSAWLVPSLHGFALHKLIRLRDNLWQVQCFDVRWHCSQISMRCMGGRNRAPRCVWGLVQHQNIWNWERYGPVSSIRLVKGMSRIVSRLASVLSEHPLILHYCEQKKLAPYGSKEERTRCRTPCWPAGEHVRIIHQREEIVELTSSSISSLVPSKLCTTPPFPPMSFPPSEPKPSARRISTKSWCAALK